MTEWTKAEGTGCAYTDRDSHTFVRVWDERTALFSLWVYRTADGPAAAAEEVRDDRTYRTIAEVEADIDCFGCRHRHACLQNPATCGFFNPPYDLS